MVLLLAGAAFAAGRIEWGSKTLKPRSDNNSWNVDIKIFMPKSPDVPTVPMKFEFQQTVYYERSMVDGDKLITRNVPMSDKQPVIESVDVGFLDPGSGKIENRTRFAFKLHRDHGFECGEYKVTIRDARTGQVIGSPTTLIFGGENEVIDRRSIVFSGEKKKEKKSDTTKVPNDTPTQKSDSTTAEAPSTPESEATKKAETPPTEDSPATTTEDKPGELKQKP